MAWQWAKLQKHCLSVVLGWKTGKSWGWLWFVMHGNMFFSTYSWTKLLRLLGISQEEDCSEEKMVLFGACCGASEANFVAIFKSHLDSHLLSSNSTHQRNLSFKFLCRQINTYQSRIKYCSSQLRGCTCRGRTKRPQTMEALKACVEVLFLGCVRSQCRKSTVVMIEVFSSFWSTEETGFDGYLIWAPSLVEQVGIQLLLSVSPAVEDSSHLEICCDSSLYGNCFSSWNMLSVSPCSRSTSFFSLISRCSFLFLGYKICSLFLSCCAWKQLKDSYSQKCYQG